ncbi:hypothetical protein CDAR_499291 [Caerostris darwini]|uniref:Uncharacterized protein n=1 Tax=Caerostris darwini TaxID=1538125 RepID=A0AAV4NZJ2_9ARAC|nr:hypothetical protein CDAR_499291 [Caerostris darwini]
MRKRKKVKEVSFLMPTGDTASLPHPLLYPKRFFDRSRPPFDHWRPHPQSRARIRLGRPRTSLSLRTRLGCEKVPRNMHSEELEKNNKAPQDARAAPNGGHLTPSPEENPNFLVYKKLHETQLTTT